MSRLKGKYLTMRGADFGVSGCVYWKYVKHAANGKNIWFKIVAGGDLGGTGGAVIVKVSEEDLLTMLRYQWWRDSVGYANPKRENLWKSEKEIDTELFSGSGGSGLDMPYDWYCAVSVILYKFCVSESAVYHLVHSRSAGLYHVLKARSDAKRGPKKIAGAGLDEAFLERYSYNKAWAVSHRSLDAFVEICKEYCIRSGTKFDFKSCKKEFDNLL